MLTVDWDNLDEAFDRLVQDELTPIATGIIATAWKQVLSRSPQYHGRLVASWNYSINSIQFVNRADLWSKGDVPVSAGHPEAIQYANYMNRDKDSQFELGDVVFFTNAADHGDGAYGFMANVDENYLRPVNRPGRAVDMTLDYIQAMWGAGVPSSAVAKLKRMHIENV